MVGGGKRRNFLDVVEVPNAIGIRVVVVMVVVLVEVVLLDSVVVVFVEFKFGFLNSDRKPRSSLKKDRETKATEFWSDHVKNCETSANISTGKREKAGLKAPGTWMASKFLSSMTRSFRWNIPATILCSSRSNSCEELD